LSFVSVLLTVLFATMPVRWASPVVACQEMTFPESSMSIRWPYLVGETVAVPVINQVLDYESITGETLAETLRNYNATQSGIVGSSFSVEYMDMSYLDISITVETLGAYPSSMVFNFLFSLSNGERITSADLFRSDKITDLIRLCDGRLQENITRELASDPLQAYAVDECHFTAEWLDEVGMSSEGIVFHYDFQYPHMIEAAEPDGELFFTWEELNGFLLPGVSR
jgi:hypothetical protein